MVDWERGSCVDHPTLPSEAWIAGTQKSFPTPRGAKALLVCDHCPIRRQCSDWFQSRSYPVVEIVVGGGWFTGAGSFRQLPEGHVDFFGAAAYLGTSVEWTKSQAGKRLHRAQTWLGRSLFLMEEVKVLAKEAGPRCGTRGAYERHLLHGEEPCRRCRSIAKYLTSLRS